MTKVHLQNTFKSQSDDKYRKSLNEYIDQVCKEAEEQLKTYKERKYNPANEVPKPYKTE